VEVFLLNLVLTPVLIGAASVAGRRWGAEVGGRLVGIPFTSGPIAFFLSLDPGPRFASDAAVGILAGTACQIAFALAYAWIALRAGWTVCLAAATVAFLAITVVLDLLRLDLAVTFTVALGSLVIALVLMPRRRVARRIEEAPPWWDIPTRMVVATVFVIALTSAAPALGAHLAGLLSPFPLYASVLAVFAHRLQGGDAAVGVLRGLVLGLFGFVAFFAAVALLLVPDGIAIAFSVALVVALAVQAASLASGRILKIA
jgi:hypothetical protein